MMGGFFSTGFFMQLSEHFTLEDFERSVTAQRMGIDNTLPAELLNDAIITAQFAERIRAALSAKAGCNVAMIVSSGYRCPELNLARKGQKKSDHMTMTAIDFIAPKFGSPYEIAKFLTTQLDALDIGQLIFEGVNGARWVHVSRKPTEKLVNRVITISDAGTEVGIQAIASA
jgi:zinc D-Ala-D-Ala carboxypeptidase